MFDIIELKIINKDGNALFCEKSEKIDTVYNGCFSEGDKFLIKTDTEEYLAVRLDETLCESIVFVPNKRMEYLIPQGRLMAGYDSTAFSGDVH